MLYWWFLLVCNLLIPVCMVAVGLLWLVRPPKKINIWYGYRTERSMRNQQTWDFAHAYSAKIMIRIGLPLTLVTIIFIIIRTVTDTANDFDSLICAAVQITAFITSFIPIERELKYRFD